MTNIPYSAVMLDLETLSTANNAAIVSIGAVRFWLNVKQPEFTEDQLFYQTVDLKSCQEVGLDIDMDTLEWWIGQNEEAKKELFSLRRVSLTSALNLFLKFIPDNVYLFGNGATFDNIILRNAFKVTKLGYPVHYRSDVCYRTLCNLSDSPLPVFEGIKHNALNDAKFQTKHLMEILEKRPWHGK